jgi:cytochrome c2
MRPNLYRYRWPLLCTAMLAGALAAALVVWKDQHQSRSVAITMAGGDPARAPDIIRRYGCGGCHTIPGIPGGDGKVGGALADLKGRVYVGGVATNTADNLIAWIVSPQTFSPRSAMPATGISEAEARDVATYLYSQ